MTWAQVGQQALDELTIVPVEPNGVAWSVGHASDGVEYRVQSDLVVAANAPDSRHFLYLRFGRSLPAERGDERIQLLLEEPVQIPGITKSLGVWCSADRSRAVGLRAIIQDMHGIHYKIWFTESCAAGWRNYTLLIPPSLVQRNWFFEGGGIAVVGLELVLPEETQTEVQIGIDALTAITDRWLEEGRDIDQIPNTW